MSLVQTMAASIVDTTGTPGNALISRQPDDPRAAWRAAIDAMLSWRQKRDRFDELNLKALDRAIDYARSLEPNLVALPTSLGPTADGGIAFEWRTQDEMTYIEIVDPHSGDYLKFQGGQLVADVTLRWDSSAGVFLLSEESD